MLFAYHNLYILHQFQVQDVTIFLNSNLFRRDEIKFVERDDDTHDSVLYALSDFGTTGDKGVRKHEDYMSKYFISQYGAIKDIDFTPIFEEILCDEKEGQGWQRENQQINIISVLREKQNSGT